MIVKIGKWGVLGLHGLSVMALFWPQDHAGEAERRNRQVPECSFDPCLFQGKGRKLQKSKNLFLKIVPEKEK